MAVKRSRSASRVLTVLEGIAQHQPIGVTELARKLDEDKSAMQRAIMTLADSGWICAAPGQPTRWQLTPHIFTVAHSGHFSNVLCQRARPVMDSLHAECDETILLAVPDNGRFVVIEVVECTQLLRTSPYVGMVIPVERSATSRAILPYMDPLAQREMLGEPPDADLQRDFEATLHRGYALSAGDVYLGSTNIAAPVFGNDGEPIAALVVSAPSDRLPPEQHAVIGSLVRRAAGRLSSGRARLTLPTTPRPEMAAAP